MIRSLIRIVFLLHICSDEDRGEWSDCVQAPHQGEPLEVGPGQR